MRLHDYYNDTGVRSVCHAIKEGCRSDYIAAKNIMVDFFSSIVKKGSVIIPAPQHTGNAIYTKDIAIEVSKRTGAYVCDVIKCAPHKTLYSLKGMGRPIEIEMYLEGDVIEEKEMYFLDNVIATGYTFFEANKLFARNLIPLAYGVDKAKFQGTI